MTKCVCGHHAWSHFASEGMCLEMSCGCDGNTPDDGSDPGTLNPRQTKYDGIYKGLYSNTLGESA